MAIKPTLEERVDEIEHILDTTNGYKPVKTIKEVAKGTAMGTANFMQEISLWKNDIFTKMEKMETSIEKLDGYMERLIDIMKSWK